MKNPLKTDWGKSLLTKYSYNGYSSHFEPVYRLAGVLCVALLAVSAFLSAKFFESWFSSLGEVGFYAGCMVSIGVAVAISILTDKVIIYYRYQKTVDVFLGSALVFLIAGNIWADFNGAPEWSGQIVGEAPTDTKTSELAGIYQPQINAIDGQISGIEEREFYWCMEHGAAHRCPVAQFYIDPKHDKKHVREIEKLKAQRSELVATMNDLIGEHGKRHGADLDEHQSKVSQTKTRLRFGSLVCTGLFLLLSLWMHNYGDKFVNEAQGGNNEGGAGREHAKPDPLPTMPEKQVLAGGFHTPSQNVGFGFQFGQGKTKIEARNGHLITCRQCGNEAVMKHASAKFCSDDCRYISHGLKKEKP